MTSDLHKPVPKVIEFGVSPASLPESDAASRMIALLPIF
jgi:hypothetical protein